MPTVLALPGHKFDNRVDGELSVTEGDCFAYEAENALCQNIELLRRV
jgi:hypothetical protein